MYRFIVSLLIVFLSAGTLFIAGSESSVTDPLPAVGKLDRETRVRVRILERIAPKKVLIRSRKNPEKTWKVTLKSFKKKKKQSKPRKEFRYHFSDGFEISAIGEKSLKRVYRGNLKVRKKGGQLILINDVELYHYLASVVMSEMGYKPLEAMKAQVILSRTWALAHLSPDKSYDFNDLTNSQVYKGLAIETRRAKKSVFETQDKILTYDNKLIEVMYHSTCSQRTYSYKEIWGVEIPYLTVVKDIADDGKLNSAHSRHFNWETTLRQKKLFSYLKRKFNLRKKITGLELQVKKGQWGVSFLGANYWAPIDTFRIMVNRQFGWLKLKSNDFVITQNKGERTIRFLGNGYGHLVGLCQVGAGKLAQKGYTTEDILQFYYPSTKIMKDHTLS